MEIIINDTAKSDKNKEFDLNERAITLEVDSDLIGEVRSGEVTHLVMQINEGNQNLILENIKGSLVLVTDEMPTTYHGCYLYNGGDKALSYWNYLSQYDWRGRPYGIYALLGK